MSTKTQKLKAEVKVGSEITSPNRPQGISSDSAITLWTVISKDGNSYTMQNKGTGAITTVYSSEVFK